MNRYSQQARNLYYSYPRRIEKGIRDYVVHKIGDKKWRVLPIPNYYLINKPEKGRYFNHPKPEGWIVEAKKFPPDTSDFGKFCFPGKDRVKNREIKCTCPDATAVDSGRIWNHTQAGLFYPCKHIIAVLLFEKVDFIEDTLKNYNHDRRNQCGDPPSPPDSYGMVIKWRESIGSRNYIGSLAFPRTAGASSVFYSNFNAISGDEFTGDFSSSYGGLFYDPPVRDDIPSYSVSGTFLAGRFFGTYVDYTITVGDPTKEPDTTTFTSIFSSLYLRSDFDSLVAVELPGASISGDLAVKTFAGNQFPGDPYEEIGNPYTIVDNIRFVVLPS